MPSRFVVGFRRATNFFQRLVIVGDDSHLGRQDRQVQLHGRCLVVVEVGKVADVEQSSIEPGPVQGHHEAVGRERDLGGVERPYRILLAPCPTLAA